MAREAFHETALTTVRRVYARQMLALVGIDRLKAARLEEAFATIPRERFLGPPPWKIMHPPAGYLDLVGGRGPVGGRQPGASGRR